MWMSLIQTNMFAQLEMRRPVLKPTLKPKLKRQLLLQVSILMVKFFRENQFDGVFLSLGNTFLCRTIAFIAPCGVVIIALLVLLKYYGCGKPGTLPKGEEDIPMNDGRLSNILRN